MIDAVLNILSRFSVKFKVGFLILFLIAGILFWNLSYISTNYGLYQNRAEVSGSLDKARAIESLMRLFQQERRAALDYLYLGGDAAAFKDVAKETTERLASMKGFMQQCRYAKKREKIEMNLARLDSIRQQLLSRELGGIDVVRFYSDSLIKHLVDIVALMTQQNSSDGYMAYFTILNGIEYSALEADLTMAVIGEGSLTEDLFEVIMVTDGKAQSALESFKRVSDFETIKRLYASYRNDHFVEINIQKENFRNRIFKRGGEKFDLSSWNRATNTYILNLRAIADLEYTRLSSVLNGEIVRYKERFYNDLVLLIIPVLAVGMVAYLVFLDINVSLRTMLGFLGGRRSDETKREHLLLLKSPSELGQVYRKLFAFNTKINKQIRIIRQNYEFDPLTALPNRVKLLRVLEKALNEKMAFSLIYIDIHNFSLINDSFGQSVGDIYLKETAEILKGLVREIVKAPQMKLRVYRMGSDEFVVVCANQDYISRVVDALTHTYLVNYNGISMPLTFTFGLAKSNSDSTSSSILTQAELAVKDASRRQQRYSVYVGDDSYKIKYKNNLEWVKRIKIAFEQNRFEPHFQPIVSTIDGSCSKLEVLVRLRQEKGSGFILPCEFLPVLQKMGHEKRLTKVIIDQSFELLHRWDKEISINMTRDDLDEDMLRYLEMSLALHKVKASSVSIELVETEELLQESYIRIIQGIKALGCKISIDDFGTGYSNFSYLAKIMPDFIKIDGSLIKDIDVNVQNRSIVQGIVDLAHSLDIKLIAEFVSTPQIYAIIQQLGIEYAQGFYFGKAESSDVILAKEGKK